MLAFTMYVYQCKLNIFLLVNQNEILDDITLHFRRFIDSFSVFFDVSKAKGLTEVICSPKYGIFNMLFGTVHNNSCLFLDILFI